MSEKRRDHRGRILHNGEIQLSDGRYRFKYVDEMGKERCVYSWRLDHNDATPKGKRRTLSLREMEKKIQADHFEQIATNGGNMTVLELVEKYTSTKTAAAGFVDYFRGKHLVVINKSDTAKSVRAELTITAPIGEVLSQITV